MYLITAAIGNKHKQFIRGWKAAYEKYNNIPYTIYTDDNLPEGVKEFCNQQKPKSLRWCKIPLIAHALSETSADVIIWCDVDILVTCNLSFYITPELINVVPYNIAGPMRDVGNGLVVPQKEYVISGLFSLPREFFVEYYDLAINSRSWSNYDDRKRGICDQAILNHLIRDKEAILLPQLGLNYWGGHSTIDKMKYLIYKNGTFCLNGHELFVIYFLSKYLDKALKRKFDFILDEKARNKLKELYGV